MFNSFFSSRNNLLAICCAIFLGLFSSVLLAEETIIENETTKQTEFKELARQVLDVMDTWARSWAQLEPKGYISSYSPNYIGKGFPSHFAWAANRQQRLQKQKRIQLSLTDVALRSTKPGYFTVTFTQNYKSDTYQDITDKKLEFKLIDNQWYIVAEKTLATK